MESVILLLLQLRDAIMIFKQSDNDHLAQFWERMKSDNDHSSFSLIHFWGSLWPCVRTVLYHMCVPQSISLDSYLKRVSNDIVFISYISCIVNLVNGQTEPWKPY